MTDEMKELLKAATVKGSYLMYKDRPLVREGNTIIYGNMEDDYVQKCSRQDHRSDHKN